ncbi:hypothetical protein ACSNOI_38560 [Actinomadura kijaniata]|uniref:hypothetical protein n=1 Tax=Actinomadura kijaniata TaxID=46161 RepID=UPI003F1C8A99
MREADRLVARTLRDGGPWPVALAAAVLGGAALQLALPYALGRAIDALVAGTPARNGWLAVCALLVAGVVVAGLATAVSLAADLPQEPGPVPALATAVLVGSALRALPPVPAAFIAAGGVAVVALTWLSGLTAVTTLATGLMAGALVLGPVLRLFGGGRRS